MLTRTSNGFCCLCVRLFRLEISCVVPERRPPAQIIIARYNCEPQDSVPSRNITPLPATARRNAA